MFLRRVFQVYRNSSMRVIPKRSEGSWFLPATSTVPLRANTKVPRFARDDNSLCDDNSLWDDKSAMPRNLWRAVVGLEARPELPRGGCFALRGVCEQVGRTALRLR